MIEVKKDGLKRLLESLQTIQKERLLVGIPQEKAQRTGEQDTNAQIGYINEYGSPANNIPARPFLQPAMDEILPECIPILRRGAESLDARRALEQCGLKCAAAVKRYITQQKGFKPPSQKTLAMRQARGFKGTKALIETGALLGSITYVLRPTEDTQ